MKMGRLKLKATVVMGDRRTKRKRTRSAKKKNAIKEQENNA